MSRNNADDVESTDVDLSAGFDVVLVPHGSTDPDIVVGKLGPGSRGVVVHTNGVQRAKRWLRLRAHGATAAVRPDREPKSTINRSETRSVFYKFAMERAEANAEKQQKYLLTKLGKSLDLVEKHEKAFRRDLRAAVRQGEEMLDETIG